MADDSCGSNSDSEIEDIVSRTFDCMKNLIFKGRTSKPTASVGPDSVLGESRVEDADRLPMTGDGCVDGENKKADEDDVCSQGKDRNNQKKDKPSRSETREKKKQKNKNFALASSIKVRLDLTDTYFQNSSSFQPVVMKKNCRNSRDVSQVISSEPKEVLPMVSQRQLKKQKKREKEQTTGKNWYHMTAPEMTEENKNDLMVLQMRSALDPKRFYKRGDRKGLPKYFQFGTVVESAVDFYHSRVPKKQRKATIVEELLADANFRSYNKRKYAEIQQKYVNDGSVPRKRKRRKRVKINK